MLSSDDNPANAAVVPAATPTSLHPHPLHPREDGIGGDSDEVRHAQSLLPLGAIYLAQRDLPRPAGHAPCRAPATLTSTPAPLARTHYDYHYHYHHHYHHHYYHYYFHYPSLLLLLRAQPYYHPHHHYYYHHHHYYHHHYHAAHTGLCLL